MNFTKTPPTKPGDYKWRITGEAACYWFAEVKPTDDGKLAAKLSSKLTWVFVENCGGEWCGPLVDASEVDKAYDEGWHDRIHRDVEMDSESCWHDSRARRVVEGVET